MSIELTKNEAFIAAVACMEILADQGQKTPQHFTEADAVIMDKIIGEMEAYVPNTRGKESTAVLMSVLNKLMEVYRNAN